MQKVHNEIKEKAEKRNQLISARQNVASVTDNAFREKAAQAIEEKQSRYNEHLKRREGDIQGMFNSRRER